jgi:hypothetical protein
MAEVTGDCPLSLVLAFGPHSLACALAFPASPAAYCIEPLNRHLLPSHEHSPLVSIRVTQA